MDRLIEDERDRTRLINFIKHQKAPFVVKITDGRPRSIEQNRLQWMWANEVAMQRGDLDSHAVQAEWKLRFGVPILLVDDPDFAAVWAGVEKKFSYEEQLQLMHVFPVTRLMTSKQLANYLDQIERHCEEQGWEITDPEERMLA